MMPADDPADLDWVLLTMGNRATDVAHAVESIRADGVGADRIHLVVNSDQPDVRAPDGCVVITPGQNLGVPGGRDVGLAESSNAIVGFLDDDAVLPAGATKRIEAAFAARPELGAVSLRLVDEAGETARRHVPRRGGADADESGDVSVFLGGACAIRRSAYLDVGGYFTELHYGHEELELCWRLIDRGWVVEYLADVEVFHPRTDISRHEDGWRLTARNRVWIARRTLPIPIAAVHVIAWLVLGLRRAPSGCRSAYLRGWLSGWRGRVGRSPIRWSTVWRLRSLGRMPIY